MMDKKHPALPEPIEEYNTLTEQEQAEYNAIADFFSDPENQELIQKGLNDVTTALESVIKFFSNPANVTKLFEESAYKLIETINPDAIPAELLEDENMQQLADQLRSGDVKGAKQTISHKISAEQFFKLEQFFRQKEITRYKNVPVRTLTDIITRDIFFDHVPSGKYRKSIYKGKKTLAKIDYDIELAQIEEKVGVYEKIIIDSIYTLMKETGSRRITGDQLYKIMTNDPEAKLTPRTIENILHGIDLATPIKVKCAILENVFDDPDAPNLDVYSQILKYDFLGIQPKTDGTPKNFTLIMREFPITGVIAERLNQLSERPFGFYQLPRGKKATKKNLSLNYELLRHVDIRTKNADYHPINLDDLMKKCGFDITDRDETKKARDLIEAILKDREDTIKNREKNPERVIENYAGYFWKKEKRSGKRTHLEIKTLEKQGTRPQKTPEKRGTRYLKTPE
jgi:hypothetical protein